MHGTDQLSPERRRADGVPSERGSHWPLRPAGDRDQHPAPRHRGLRATAAAGRPIAAAGGGVGADRDRGRYPRRHRGGARRDAAAGPASAGHDRASAPSVGRDRAGPARRGARGCHQADRVLPAAGSGLPDTGLRSGLRAAVPSAGRRRHRAVRRRRRRPCARPAAARPVPPPRRRRSSHGGRRRCRGPDRDAASRARRHVPPPADDDREGPAVQAGRAVRQPARDRLGPGRRRGGHDSAVQIDGLHLRGRAP